MSTNVGRPYHFNEVTGKTSPCRAVKERCPLIHGQSPEEARKNYENVMDKSTIGVLRKYNPPRSKRELMTMPAMVLSRTPLKDMDAAQLAATIRHEAVDAGMDAETIDSAIELASILHAHQTRGNRGAFITTAYIEHPLRNGLRLIRMGVTDQDTVVGAILHDTVEDGSEVFVKKFEGHVGKVDEAQARIRLSAHIGAAYGRDVEIIVAGMTNEYVPAKDAATLSLEQKHLTYKDHVAEQISQDVRVLLGKSSDFIDNASGLHHNDTPARAEKTYKQARKYRPVVDVFIHAINQSDIPISDQEKRKLIAKMEETKVRLDELIAKYDPQFGAKN